jgi:hypothetical protein
MRPMKFRPQLLGGFALIIGLVALSIAVFNWGLQYKMSLYQESNAVTNAPAKLWTGRTLTAATAALDVEPQQEVLLLVALLVSLSPMPEKWLRGLAIPAKLQLRAALRAAFSFRPPPVLA